MTLEQWLDNSWLTKIKPSAYQVRNLLALAEREMADASLDGISDDGKFDHGYSAVRSLCQAALHAAGFDVPKGGRQHERVIESVRFTLGDDWAADADFFDQCRRMRHKTLYEGTGIASPKDASDLLSAAKKLRRAVDAWLKKNHPKLLK